MKTSRFSEAQMKSPQTNPEDYLGLGERVKLSRQLTAACNLVLDFTYLALESCLYSQQL